jgi:hypothetical protein
VAEAFHQRLDVHGDEGLVLDDEDVGGDLGRELAAGFLNQIAKAGRSQSRIAAASSSEKPSRATRRKACRGRGVICVRWRSGARFDSSASAFSFTGTEFQIFVNSR